MAYLPWWIIALSTLLRAQPWCDLPELHNTMLTVTLTQAMRETEAGEGSAFAHGPPTGHGPQAWFSNFHTGVGGVPLLPRWAGPGIGSYWCKDRGG